MKAFPPFRKFWLALALPLMLTGLTVRQSAAGVAVDPIIVTTTHDSGTGSLRDALDTANRAPGADVIRFNIGGAGPHVIAPITPLPTVLESVAIDGYSQFGSSLNAQERGTDAVLQIEISGMHLPSGPGIHLFNGSSVVTGICFSGFSTGPAIKIGNGGGNSVQGCFIGTTPDGTQAASSPNLIGIKIENSSQNKIGGTELGQRNLISGQRGTPGNPGYGILVVDGEGDTENNVIQGNLIGPIDSGQTSPINDQIGIYVLDAPGTRIGGGEPGAGNQISGNEDTGIRIEGPGAQNTVIQGNLIGTNVNGTTSNPNFSNGITILDGPDGTQIGGSQTDEGNVISGNAEYGIYIDSFSDPCDGTTIYGNTIGTNRAGNESVSNGQGGIFVFDSPNTQIGGIVEGEGNLLSGNGDVGTAAAIHLEGANSSGAVIRGNLIGPSGGGTNLIGNFGAGIRVNGVSNTRIIENVISGNFYGVIVYNTAYPAASDNRIERNLIGTDGTGTEAWGNTGLGIELRNASGNIVGGGDGGGNLIAYNGEGGVVVDQASINNAIVGNSIHSNGGLGIDLSAPPLQQDGVTPNDAGDGDAGPNNLQNFPVLTGVTFGVESTIVSGTLNSTPNTTFRLEFFDNTTVDPSGHGEGEVFWSWDFVTTDGNGQGSFAVMLPGLLETGHQITATATDPNGNTSEFSAPPTEGDEDPPVITNCTVTPRTLGPAGGGVTVRANVQDNRGVSRVTARFTIAGPSSAGEVIVVPGGITATLVEVSPGTYEGTATLPANPSPNPVVYDVRVIAEDTSSNQAQEPCGQVTVAAGDAEAPVISACSVTPTQLTPLGGQLALSATVTDNVGVASVRARILRPNGTTALVTLTRGAGDTFTGSFNVPVNISGQNQTYTVHVDATDSSGNQTTMPCGDVTVAGDQEPPAITECALSPTRLPFRGGTVVITATVTDDISVSSVSALVRRPDDSVAQVPMARQPNGSYRGQFAAPANSSTVDQTYGVVIAARDTSNNLREVACGTFSVILRDVERPVLSAPIVAPRVLPNSGGTVGLAITVSDNLSIDQVAATVVRAGQAPVRVSLSPQGNGAYTGSFAAPANPTERAHIYGVAFSATDGSGNLSTVDAGVFTVGPSDLTGPRIRNCRVSPRTLTGLGGVVTLAAEVTDDVAMRSVVANILFPDGSPLAVTLNPGQDGAYVGQFTALQNRTTRSEFYAIEVRAEDTSGNARTEDCGRVTVGPRRPGRLELSARAIDFGRVEKGNLVTRKLVLTNNGTDSLVTGTVRPLRDPFGVSFGSGKGSAPAGEGQEPSGLPFTLGPGESVELTISFHPQRLGRFSQLMLIESNDPVRPTVRFRVSGHSCRLVRNR